MEVTDGFCSNFYSIIALIFARILWIMWSPCYVWKLNLRWGIEFLEILLVHFSSNIVGTYLYLRWAWIIILLVVNLVWMLAVIIISGCHFFNLIRCKNASILIRRLILKHNNPCSKRLYIDCLSCIEILEKKELKCASLALCRFHENLIKRT